MAAGILFLLLVILGGATLLFHLPRPVAQKILLTILVLGISVLAFLLLRTLLEGSYPLAPRVLFSLLLITLGFLLVWAMKQVLRSAFVDVPPAPPDPRRRGDLPSSLVPAGELARLAGPLAARLGHLSFRSVALRSLIPAVLAFPVLVVICSPRHPDEVGVPFLLALFVWAGFVVAFSLVVGLSRAVSRDSCPSIGRLKEFLADRLPSEERGRLGAHLELCSVCQHRLEGLTAGQQAWSGLADKLSERPAAPGPALRKVMDRLKEEDDGATGDEAVFCGDLPLGFLGPADKPGLLGRLERYDVLEEVGRGGMGVVFKAFDPTLHRVVAIKVLAPQLATSGVARKRFLREAKAAAAVSHDHIVTIHAVEEANGLPYLVMQYVAGRSLQERIDRDGPLELADVLRIGMQTASGLAAAHAHGIVHRDIKPANILLEEGVGRVKLTDFGLARAMDDASLTQSGFVAGSPLYMAPEQARGEALDHRADLFSLGSVLYTMCTGRPPFRAANTLAVLRRVSEDAPRPIRETNPEVPDWLADIVSRLMAKHPEDRFTSAGEVVEVLGRHLAQLQGASWTPPAGALEPGLPSSLTLCPSCGASLHVPEHMVGTQVHCAECGKPFQVEDTSEVIQVARAVKPPFGPARRPRRRMRGLVWVGCACACAGIPPLVLILYFSLRVSEPTAAIEVQTPVSSTQTSSPASAQDNGQPKVPIAPSEPFWRNMLNWLAAEATCFGAIDLKPFGALSLDDSRTQVLLRLVASEKTAERLTTENLGRIRVERVALALYEETKPDDIQTVVGLEGLTLDGPRRILDFLRAETGDKLKVEANNQWSGARPVRISSPALPFALGIFDDSHVFLGISGARDAGVDQHRKALAQASVFNFSDHPRRAGDVLSGYNPPWLRDALKEIESHPRDSLIIEIPGDPGHWIRDEIREPCGLFIGEIPGQLRRRLTEALPLRVCPRSFVCVLTRQGSGVAVSLTLNVDRPGAELILAQDFEKLQREGLSAWQAHHPALQKEPEALTLVDHQLQSMRWGANPGGRSVQTNTEVSAQTWEALLTLLRRTLW